MTPENAVDKQNRRSVSQGVGGPYVCHTHGIEYGICKLVITDVLLDSRSHPLKVISLTPASHYNVMIFSVHFWLFG